MTSKLAGVVSRHIDTTDDVVQWHDIVSLSCGLSFQEPYMYNVMYMTSIVHAVHNLLVKFSVSVHSAQLVS